MRASGLFPPEAMTGRKELVGQRERADAARRIFMSPTFFGVLVVRIKGRTGQAHAQARELPNRQNLCPCEKKGHTQAGGCPRDRREHAGDWARNPDPCSPRRRSICPR